MNAKTEIIIKEITQELEIRFRALIDICESPIEEYFLVNLCQYFYAQSLIFLNFDFLTRLVDDPHSPLTQKIEPSNYNEKNTDIYGFIYGVKITQNIDTVYKIIPQFKHKGYRLDFAIIIEKPNSNNKFCIECDGHEYHRTKEQILKDSKRSRDLARDGWTTLRYTGSELFRWNSDNAQDLEIILIEFLKSVN